MTIKDTLYIFGTINLIEGSLGIVYGKIFIKNWSNVSLSTAILIFVVGCLCFYFAQKKL